MSDQDPGLINRGAETLKSDLDELTIIFDELTELDQRRNLLLGWISERLERIGDNDAGFMVYPYYPSNTAVGQLFRGSRLVENSPRAFRALGANIMLDGSIVFHDWSKDQRLVVEKGGCFSVSEMGNDEDQHKIVTDLQHKERLIKIIKETTTKLGYPFTGLEKKNVEDLEFVARQFGCQISEDIDFSK